MSTDWDCLYRRANHAGMDAYERGDSRDTNPHGPATFQRERWFEGWDNAKELAHQDIAGATAQRCTS